MLLNRINGATSNVIRVKLLNSSVTTGAGLTGLTSASSGLIISTIADNEATPTIYTVAASNVETITTLGTFAAPTASKCRFKEVDATNHPGLYELQFANARFAVSSAKHLVVSVSGATNLAQCDFVIDLQSQVDVRSWIGTIVATALQTAADIRAEMDANSTKLALLGTPANATLAADIAAVKVDTASASARLPASLNAGYMRVSLEAFNGIAMIGTGNLLDNLRPTGVPAG